LDTIAQLLIEKGIFTSDEFYARLKQVQAEYVSRQQWSRESYPVVRPVLTGLHSTLPSRRACNTAAGCQRAA